jgi:hypothetical protein
MYLFYIRTLHNNVDVEMAVRGKLQMQLLVELPKGPRTRTVLPSILIAQAKLFQVCSVWPARGFTTYVQLNLKNIDQFSL